MPKSLGLAEIKRDCVLKKNKIADVSLNIEVSFKEKEKLFWARLDLLHKSGQANPHKVQPLGVSKKSRPLMPPYPIPACL